MLRLALALTLLAVAGCDSTADGPRDLPAVDAGAAVEVTDPAELAAARAAWEAAGIVDYEVRYSRFCFCIGSEFQFRVDDGRVVEGWMDGEPIVGDVPIEAITVDVLFAEAARALETADAVSVRVLPAAPFIVGFSADYDVDVADEELGYTITGFERL